MSEAAVARILEVLSAPESPLRTEGVRLVIDHILEQPLREVVDLTQVHALILDALGPEQLGPIVAAHVKPGWRRYAASIASSDARVSDLVSEPVRQELRALAQGLRLPRAQWARGCVEPQLLRRLLGPVWVQVLLSFAKRFPIPGLGGAAVPASPAPARGLAGALGRAVTERAGRMVDAGRSVMEGLGIDVEKKLLTAAREFSEGALSVWNSALRERLASEEGRALIAELNLSVLEHVLRTRFRDLQLDAAELPIEALLDTLPELVSHAARSGFVNDIVQRELQAFLESEGDKSVRALLEELGIADGVRAQWIEKGDELLRTLSARPSVAEWLARLLSS
jgi:hypothetical protein